jgi:hypothetical protein
LLEFVSCPIDPGKLATSVMGDLAPRDRFAPRPFAFADAGRVLGMTEAAGWGVSVETVDLHLTPLGRVTSVAQLHTIIGAAPLCNPPARVVSGRHDTAVCLYP